MDELTKEQLELSKRVFLVTGDGWVWRPEFVDDAVCTKCGIPNQVVLTNLVRTIDGCGGVFIRSAETDQECFHCHTSLAWVSWSDYFIKRHNLRVVDAEPRNVQIHFGEDGRYVSMPLTIYAPKGITGKAERSAIEDYVADVWGNFEAVDYIPNKKEGQRVVQV